MPDNTKVFSDGALPDSRPIEKRWKDYTAAEIPAGAAIAFANEKVTELKATVYNQWYVSDCVPHGFYTQLEYEGIVPKSGMSQLRAYRKRANYPGAGCIAVDMYDQIRSGQMRQSDFPTPAGFSEAQANAMPLLAGSELIGDFTYFQYKDINGNLMLDLVPSDVASGKAVAIYIYATEDEWSQEYVEIKDPLLTLNAAAVRHCVCLIPKGDFTENGKQWLSVHDSAKFGGRHLRYISRDFFMKRSYMASKVYPKTLAPAPNPDPIEKPTIVCKLGDSGEAVKRLQNFLINDGKLEKQYLTGYYGSLTAKAVLWWQLEHWDKYADQIPTLLDYAGKYWGAQSVAIIK